MGSYIIWVWVGVRVLKDDLLSCEYLFYKHKQQLNVSFIRFGIVYILLFEYFICYNLMVDLSRLFSFFS